MIQRLRARILHTRKPGRMSIAPGPVRCLPLLILPYSPLFSVNSGARQIDSGAAGPPDDQIGPDTIPPQDRAVAEGGVAPEDRIAIEGLKIGEARCPPDDLCSPQ